MTEAIHAAGHEFDAVGGLVLGAAHVAIGIAFAAKCGWFLVEKEPDKHYPFRQIQGKRIGPGNKVVVVDDAVTSGGSIILACDLVAATGAKIVAATTLIDRGDIATELFEQRGIDYFPMATYHDLGIGPVVL